MSRNAERILGTNGVTTRIVRQTLFQFEHDLRFYEMKTKARKTEEVTTPRVCVLACQVSSVVSDFVPPYGLQAPLSMWIL